MHFALQQKQEGKENVVRTRTKVQNEEFRLKKKKKRIEIRIQSRLPRSLNIRVKYLNGRMESVSPPLAAVLYCSDRR